MLTTGIGKVMAKEKEKFFVKLKFIREISGFDLFFFFFFFFFFTSLKSNLNNKSFNSSRFENRSISRKNTNVFTRIPDHQ